MAYASITAELKSNVNAKITGLKYSELGTMTDPDGISEKIVNNTEIRDHVVNLLWDKTEPDLRERLEKYNKEASIRFQVQVPVEFRKEGTYSLTREYLIPTAKIVPCMTALHNGYGARVHETYEVDFYISPLFADHAEAYKNRLECVNRWDAVATQVIKFLESCKSANEAIKLWPDVARYLPQATLDKINHKAEKQVKGASAALAALQGIDMDAVNTSTVLARMAGAKI